MNEPEHNSPTPRKSVWIRRYQQDSFEEVDDFVAVEEPLEIRVLFGPEGRRKDRSLSITMRTPGHDHELAAGFLVGEGIVERPDELLRFEQLQTAGSDSEGSNQLCVHLAPEVDFDFASLQRNFYMTSSCGICGTASLEAVRARVSRPIDDREIIVDAKVITCLPDRLRTRQKTFAETGGLHAAALFRADGQLLDCREDIGRHNALDKLVGRSFLDRQLPRGEHILLVSGRASFELVQKTVLAGIPILAAVGAPSSLAVELATEFGVTLLGFVSDSRFNVYSHPQRIR